MADVSEYSPRLIKDRIQELEAKIEQAKASGGKAELRRQKSELESELSRIKSEADQAVRERTKGIQDEIYRLQDQQAKAEHEKSQASQDLGQIERTISRGQARMQELSTKYKDLAAKEAQADDVCPTCGQDLPEDQVQAAIDKFNAHKVEQLRKINDEGKSLKAQVQEAEGKKETLQQKIQDLTGQVETLQGQVSQKQSELSQAQGQPSPDAERIQEAQAKIQRISDQLSQENSQADTSGIEQVIEQELQTERTKLSEIEATKKSQSRVNELKEEEKNLAKRTVIRKACKLLINSGADSYLRAAVTRSEQVQAEHVAQVEADQHANQGEILDVEYSQAQGPQKLDQMDAATGEVFEPGPESDQAQEPVTEAKQAQTVTEPEQAMAGSEPAF